MRFFLHHDDLIVSAHDIIEKTKSKSALARKEVSTLAALGFLEKKKGKTVVTSSTGKQKASKVKEVVGFKLNPDFPHIQALKDLLFDFESLDKRELAQRFKVIGRIKLFIVAGVFIGDDTSRVDILIVGEAIKRPKAEKLMDMLSAELGRDVVYSIMDVEEYTYRYRMYDRFVRDIIDFPKEVVIDKLTPKVAA